MNARNLCVFSSDGVFGNQSVGLLYRQYCRKVSSKTGDSITTRSFWPLP
jgi:hypothetical protein